MADPKSYDAPGEACDHAHEERCTPPEKLTPAEAFGARVRAALKHANLTPVQVHHLLVNRFKIRVSLQSVYDAKNGVVARPRITPELAKITGVSQDWLHSGQGLMLDQPEKQDLKLSDLKLYASEAIPEGRSDLMVLADNFLERIFRAPFSPQEAEIMLALMKKMQPQKLKELKS